MSHRTAFYLALAWVAVIAYDGIIQDWAWAVFFGRRLFDLILWIQFWR